MSPSEYTGVDMGGLGGHLLVRDPGERLRLALLQLSAHRLQNIFGELRALTIHQFISFQNLRVTTHGGSHGLQPSCLGIQQGVGAVLPHRKLHNHIATAHRLDGVNEAAKGHRITKVQTLSVSLQLVPQITRTGDFQVSLRVLLAQAREGVQQNVNALLGG